MHPLSHQNTKEKKLIEVARGTANIKHAGRRDKKWERLWWGGGEDKGVNKMLDTTVQRRT